MVSKRMEDRSVLATLSIPASDDTEPTDKTLAAKKQQRWHIPTNDHPLL